MTLLTVCPGRADWREHWASEEGAGRIPCEQGYGPQRSPQGTHFHSHLWPLWQGPHSQWPDGWLWWCFDSSFWSSHWHPWCIFCKYERKRLCTVPLCMLGSMYVCVWTCVCVCVCVCMIQTTSVSKMYFGAHTCVCVCVCVRDTDISFESVLWCVCACVCVHVRVHACVSLCASTVVIINRDICS